MLVLESKLILHKIVNHIISKNCLTIIYPRSGWQIIVNCKCANWISRWSSQLNGSFHMIFICSKIQSKDTIFRFPGKDNYLLITDIIYWLLTLATECWHYLLHTDIIYCILTLSTAYGHYLLHTDIIYCILTLSTAYWHYLLHTDIIYWILTLSTQYWHRLPDSVAWTAPMNIL